MIKLFGFDDESIDCAELTQVTLEIVNVESLRAMASFLEQCATEIESDPDWEHEHFSDFLESELESDLVVFNRGKYIQNL